MSSTGVAKIFGAVIAVNNQRVLVEPLVKKDVLHNCATLINFNFHTCKDINNIVLLIQKLIIL